LEQWLIGAVVEMNYSIRKRIFGRGCIALLIVCAYAGLIPPAFSQQESDRYLQANEGRSEDGEGTSAMMDEIINQCRSTRNKVHIISRLGTRDTRANLHKRRLHNAVARLVDYSTPLLKEQVSTEIGERVEGKGTVEIYVGGRPVYTVYFTPNADFTVDCCEIEPNYYPWYKEPKPKPRPRRHTN
jgi:hypothetical protein